MTCNTMRMRCIETDRARPLMPPIYGKGHTYMDIRHLCKIISHMWQFNRQKRQIIDDAPCPPPIFQ